MDARILLVEDDVDLRETVAAALDALADNEQDVALLDVARGRGPDGVEVCAGGCALLGSRGRPAARRRPGARQHALSGAL
jgi:hypothetical protein